MKNKSVTKSNKTDKKHPNSVLNQLHNHLQNYLDALKSVNENTEYHHLMR